MNFNKDISQRKKSQAVTHVSEIIVYGTSWCGMTQMIRRYLDRLEIPYTFHDIEEDQEAANQLRWITGGYLGHPSVVVEGQSLIQPDMEEFRDTLAKYGYV